MIGRSKPGERWTPRRTRLVVGLVVIAAAVGVLLWLAVGRGAVYYYSVSELKALGQVQHVRVSGRLQTGSLVDGGRQQFTFVLYDRDRPAETVSVSYRGAVPDTLRNQPGADLVAEGDYDGHGRFAAGTLITKCPSKYEAAQ
jgi:cytochrome c-type biogenesis protein CcmE